MSMNKETFVSGETRDSKLRITLGPVIESTVKFLYKHAPWLTPNVITTLGTISVAAGVSLAIYDQAQPKTLQRPIVGLIVTTLGELTDGIDGTAARYRQEILNINTDSVRGMFMDVISDRTQEFMMSLARAANARRRGDQWGEFTAFVSAITNTLPSLLRARAESQGFSVEENALGSRLGRAILGTVALHFPRFKEIPLQSTIDAIMSLTNVTLAINRAKAPHNRKSSDVSIDLQELAKKRASVLTAFTVVSVVGALVAYGVIERRQKSK